MVGAGPTARVLLGRITGAHGIRGEVVIATYTAQADAIGRYGPLTDTSGRHAITITATRQIGKRLVAAIAGVTDRNAAEALAGTDLFVTRDRLPEPEHGAYYVADLIGMTAVDRAGREIGHIVDVANYGAGDILEVKPVDGGETELIAFTDANVPMIDVVARRMTIVRPAEIDAREGENE